MAGRWQVSSPLVNWGSRLPQKALDVFAKIGEPMENAVHGAEGLLGFKPQPPPDTSWHDSMVQGANQSFQQPVIRRKMPVKGM